jgi:hypothetical protein
MTELESNILTMSKDQRRVWQLINALHPKMRSRVVRDLQSINTVESVLAYAGRNKFTAVDEVSERKTRKSDSGESRSRNNTSHSTRRRFYRDAPNNVSDLSNLTKRKSWGRSRKRLESEAQRRHHKVFALIVARKVTI